ncbi:Sodium-dependent dicarboxylate transporter SdcS [Rubripirellula lacrimiformis]|uniref:Sodium-dependent dicarboxylate transporter SdcS n=1 Tax=Rubripirellula lacrimiformis TaxID=1930273 RepID=A0A517N526_9BACT|nr:SLC13 family permease [Rubripirellula lacrimiformis]QDT02232.1 Sodium-dependent dicarboxylate transporter SdcS [Rubripirellula lacrimiformis]
MLNKISSWMLPAAPIIALVVALIAHRCGLTSPASACAWVAITCALWWIFECTHIAIAGLLPFVAFPVLGVLDHGRVAQSYGHTIILLLMGGFFLSASMEKSGAHRRIALSMVKAVGGQGGRRLVLGFMLATSLLSMWISNSATTLMILPIALAVLSDANDPKLRTPLLLGIAYAASIGGMATPIGTPPNVYFMSFMQTEYDIELTFGQWMSIGLPITCILFPAIWLWVTRSLKDAMPLVMPEVGDWRPSERRVLWVFAFTAAAWIFRLAPFGGWSQFLPDGGSAVGDTTVALAASLFLFLCPSGEPAPKPDKLTSGVLPTSTLLDWQTAKGIPWGILIMFGGGIALADGFKSTGLSESIGNQLTIFNTAPSWVVVLSVCLLVTFLTEMTSSTATAMLMMPILAGLADATNMSPQSVLIPGTISASCAFMLPVATAPNVIIFGAGGIRTADMARNGFALNIYASIVITTVALLLG